MDQIEHISESMEPLNARLKRCLPKDSPAKRLNLALLLYLSDFTQNPGKNIVNDLIHGMPLTGEVPASGSLAPDRKEAKVSLGEVINTVKVREEQIKASFRKRPTMQEIEDG